jgi:hypothetical protein
MGLPHMYVGRRLTSFEYSSLASLGRALANRQGPDILLVRSIHVSPTTFLAQILLQDGEQDSLIKSMQEVEALGST